MPLSSADTAQLEALLAGSPLARSSTFVSDLADRLDAQRADINQVLFRAGGAVDYLYLVAEGRLLQTYGVSGQQWFQKELCPGDFFGQQALFAGRHQTRVMAAEPSKLFSMTAIALRDMLQRYPALEEELLHDQRAQRLRSMPLFESLSDDDVKWLSQLVEERRLAPGQEVPLGSKPGLRIIDWGQVEVAGPVSFGPNWRLTAGNYFFSMAPGASSAAGGQRGTHQGSRLGSRSAATTAHTTLETNLFYLSEADFDRLLDAFPEIGTAVRKPLDIVSFLRRIPLFIDGPGMTERHREHLAGYFAWEFVPANQNITSQGAVGYSYIIVRRGNALVTAVDEKGHLRPRNMLRPGDSFGTTSLLESKQRDATVRAVRGEATPNLQPLPGTEILNLDRRDLEVAFADAPDLWHAGVALYDRAETIRSLRPRYDWLQEGEVVTWSDRSHELWLIGPLLVELLAFLAVCIPLLLARVPMLVLVLLAVFVLLPLAAYTILNYRDDYYVVTNRRVTRRDRELFYREARTEAPLEMVQDVTVRADLMGRLFNFGQVTIRTAAKVGSIVFTNVPDAETVKDTIMGAKAGAAAASRGNRQETLRTGLLNDLRVALPVPDLDRMRALGENARPQQHWSLLERAWRSLTDRGSRRPSVPYYRRPNPFRVLFRPLPERMRKVLLGPPPPPPRQYSGPIVWHKHPINFFQRAGVPLLGAILLLVLLFVGYRYRVLLANDFVPVMLVLIFLMMLDSGWLWWESADYWNDVYVVTDDRIIDIERRPLALSERRRESPIDRIQTVNSVQNGFWANVLNYGDVLIQTAAADEGYTFNTVRSPRQVQKAVFQKVDVYRRRQEQMLVDQRRQEMVEGLRVYHELSEDRP